MAAPEEAFNFDPEPLPDETETKKPASKKSKKGDDDGDGVRADKSKPKRDRDDRDDDKRDKRDRRDRDRDDDRDDEPKSKRDKRDRDDEDDRDPPREKKGKRDADDEDDADAPRSKKRKDDGDDDEGDSSRGKKRKRDDDDGDSPKKLKKGSRTEDSEPRRKPPKLGDRKVPYPPPPPDVPEGLTEYEESYIKQQKKLLTGLFLFLALYIGAVLFSLMMIIWCVWSLWHWFPIKVAGLVFFTAFFVFLIKGFFKHRGIDRDTVIELTEDEHPVLFEFIYQLCEEVGAPLPNRVLVSPDVNAACIPHTNLFSLFKEPKKDLLLGLGLVNAVNLSEFKAILGHEFGHFCQDLSARGYTYIAQTVILDMIRGEDWFDRTIERMKKSESFKWLGLGLGGPLWLWKVILAKTFNMIALQNRKAAQEQEFHADLVAVTAAGSDPATHGLLRARFGMECFIQALRDLVTATDHKMFTNDLYLHQSRAAATVRRIKKEPEMGLPPAVLSKNVRVFDAEQEALEDEDTTPPMWRFHPSDADREENVKRQYVPTVIDHRSPWILFDKVGDLKERMTYKFYRTHRAFSIPKGTELTDAQEVQTFIDNEHAETTYDPKYNGIYDDRPLEPVAPNKDGTPGDLGELDTLVVEKPWTDDRIEKVLDKLYEGCRAKAEELDELRKERAMLDNTPGKKSSRLKKKIKDIDEKLDTLWEWLRSLDRRVYLIHVQMAGSLSKEQKQDLVDRYRFQLEVQRLYWEARHNQERALAFARLLFSLPPDRVPPELGTEIMSILPQVVARALKKIIQDARDINLPAMKNFEEGESLADFILEGKMVPEPPLTYVKLDWCQKLVNQLAAVRSRCWRLHTKSLGGILALQEKITLQWRKLREPVAAEVLDAPPVEAEVLPAEVVPAEPVAALPAEPIAAEVVAEELPAEIVAEALPDDVIAAEVLPEPLPAAPEPSKAMAAFVAPAPAPAARAPLPPPPAPAPVPPEPDPLPVEVVAEVAEVVAEPLPVEEPTPAAPVAQAAPAPAPAPAEGLPADPVAQTLAMGTGPVEEVFSLDAAEVVAEVAEAPAPAAPAPAPATPVAADEVFSLDADATKPVPKVEDAPFSLDADDQKPAPAKPASGVVAAPAKPAGSTGVPAPAAHPAPTLSGVAPTPATRVAPITKPASGKRPAIKITMVRPGEKSPLGK